MWGALNAIGFIWLTIFFHDRMLESIILSESLSSEAVGEKLFHVYTCPCVTLFAAKNCKWLRNLGSRNKYVISKEKLCRSHKTKISDNHHSSIDEEKTHSRIFREQSARKKAHYFSEKSTSQVTWPFSRVTCQKFCLTGLWLTALECLATICGDCVVNVTTALLPNGAGLHLSTN